MRWADDESRSAALRCSIRIVKPAVEHTCPRCGQPFQAAGPTGHVDERPICGVCLLATDYDLGMAMSVLTLNRTIGLDVGPHSPDEETRRQAIEQISALAAIYAGYAAHYDLDPPLPVSRAQSRTSCQGRDRGIPQPEERPEKCP